MPASACASGLTEEDEAIFATDPSPEICFCKEAKKIGQATSTTFPKEEVQKTSGERLEEEGEEGDAEEP